MNRNIFSRIVSLFGFGSDVVTVSSGTAGSAGNVAASLITYLSAKLLNVAELNMVLDQFGEKEPLPAGSSKTIRFVRMEKLPVAKTPTQLTEGVAPDARGLTLNQIEATAEQYGDLIRISDLAELTAKHAVVSRALYMLGLQVAEIYDQLIFNVIDAASNQYWPNAKTADTGLVGSDRIGYIDLITNLASLQDQGGRPVRGQNYVYACPPQVHAALLNDPDWKASHQLVDPSRIWSGQVGMLGNFDVVTTNAPAFAATLQATSGQASKVYSSFCFAAQSYMITDLQSVQVYNTPPGGQYDPLYQSRKLAWKFAFKAVIVNQNWLRRIRSSGLDSRTN